MRPLYLRNHYGNVFFASFYPVGYAASSAFAFMKEMNADFM